MAPLAEAVKTRFKGKDGGWDVYEGEVDPLWTIAAIPQGALKSFTIRCPVETGYALGLIVDAAIQAQAITSQPDICHCTAHFLRSALCKHYEVRIRREKMGRGFSNLVGELVQDGNVRITTHMIFTKLSEPPSPGLPSADNLTITPPSPYARRTPLETHPSKSKAAQLTTKFVFREKMRWTGNEAATIKRNKRLSKGKSKNGGLEWSTWAQVTDANDRVSTATLPFWGDMFVNLPELLPKHQRPGTSWYPTMVYSIEFKTKIPTSASFATRTIGIFHKGVYMHDGRHDATVEVWTAPAEFGDKQATVDKDWREKQHCLCVARQMALVLPIAVNEKRRASKL